MTLIELQNALKFSNYAEIMRQTGLTRRQIDMVADRDTERDPLAEASAKLSTFYQSAVPAETADR